MFVCVRRLHTVLSTRPHDNRPEHGGDILSLSYLYLSVHRSKNCLLSCLFCVTSKVFTVRSETCSAEEPACRLYELGCEADVSITLYTQPV
jgi:hypothetical protein